MRLRISRWGTACVGVALFGCGTDSPLTSLTGASTLAVVSGDNQRGKAGYELAEPLVVRVTNAQGEGLSGVPVVWNVTSGEGVLDGLWTRCGPAGTPSAEGLGNPIPTRIVSTAADGLARVAFMPTWFGAVTVEAYVEGIDGSPVTFTIDARDPGATLEILSGDEQEGVAGPWTTQSEPFVVRLRNGDGAPVPYVLVTWSVASGDGVLIDGGSCPDGDRMSPTTLRTRSDATHTPERRLEFRPRVFGISRVTAAVPGVQGSPVTFTMDATVVQVGFGHDPFLDSTFFFGPHFTSDVVVPLGAPVEFVTAPGARVSSTTVPSGGLEFDSGVLADGERFRFVPGVTGIWEFVEQGSGAKGTLTAHAPDDGTQGATVTLVVSSVTTGGAFDVDGYLMKVTTAGGRSFTHRLDLNDSWALPKLLPSSEAHIEVEDVASNCLVEAGSSRTVALRSDARIEVQFRVSCAAPPELASIELLFSRYADAEGTRSSFYRMRADGTALRKLSGGMDLDRRPAVSPDGRGVAFSRGEFSGGWGGSRLHVMNVEGGSVTPLTAGPFAELPSWSPQSGRIAFYATATQLDVINADGAGRRMIFSGVLENDHVPAAWSPDGSSVAFIRPSGVEFEEPWRRGWEVWTVPADGGAAQPIGQFVVGLTPLRLAWSGAVIRVLAWGGNALWVMNADGSGAARVTDPGIDFELVEVTDWLPEGHLVTLTGRVRSPTLGRLRRADIYLANIAERSLLRVTADGSSFDAAFLRE